MRVSGRMRGDAEFSSLLAKLRGQLLSRVVLVRARLQLSSSQARADAQLMSLDRRYSPPFLTSLSHRLVEEIGPSSVWQSIHQP